MFKDRKDGGEKLAKALEKYNHSNALVLGIPRGGVETAYYVARHLNTELSVVIVRKLGYPLNPEAAFGAVAEDGSLYISEMASENLTSAQISEVLENQKQEIQRRVIKLRGGAPIPAMKGRTVILVDDGIATGATLFASIDLCKKQKAGKIVVAAPISVARMDTILRSKVDDVIILETPAFYSAVSQGYENFHNLTDEEALLFLKTRAAEYSHHPA